MKANVIIGVNCSHDAAACIALEGRVACAISEERLTRQKHYFGYPTKAIEYCLDEVGAREPDLVVINQMPPAVNEAVVRRRFRTLGNDAVIVNPSHHFLHACYARMFASDRPIVVLVADGSGYSYAEHSSRKSPLLGNPPRHPAMCESLSGYYFDESNRVSLLLKSWGEWKDGRLLRFPSLGHMYGAAAQHVFGSWVHAGKLMGLASYGNPDEANIDAIVRPCAQEGIVVDTEWILDLRPMSSTDRLEENAYACNIAAKVQLELEKGMRHITSVLFEMTRCDSICLAGGVALNSVFNGRLTREGPFRNVVITPAAHDAGTAIGAAAYGYRAATQRTLAFIGDSECLGHTYEDQEVQQVLASACDVISERVSDPTRAAACDLAQGRIVGWFEGPSEFGPRALGHRSILADPRSPTAKQELNARIKFRESFRPYAAAVLREECGHWFEDDFDSPHMLLVSTVRHVHANSIPAVVHVDGTCRIQTVDSEYRGSLRRVIEAFYSMTGVPMVLNTSLNVRGEPMSETPQDAVQCLLRSDLDTLYCGNYRVQKRIDHIGHGPRARNC